MKTKTILFTSVVAFLLMAVGCAGDKDDNRIWEISPNSDKQKIECEINGILFEFCLLNDQGKPATVFNKGENFTFYFSIKNSTGNDFYYNAYENANIEDFFRVIGASQQDIGKSYEVLPQADVGIAAYPFNDGDISVFEIPWLHTEEAVFQGGDFFFKSIQQKPLKVGDFYTSFSNVFAITNTSDGKSLNIGKCTFKINFQIKEL